MKRHVIYEPKRKRDGVTRLLVEVQPDGGIVFEREEWTGGFREFGILRRGYWTPSIFPHDAATLSGPELQGLINWLGADAEAKENAWR